MRSAAIRVIGAALIAAGLGLGALPAQAEMRILHVRTFDHALADAFKAARRTLNTVIGAMEKSHGRFSPSLAFRVAMAVGETKSEVELVWVDRIRRKGDGFEGYLASHPQQMPGKRMGSKVDFLHPQVADWAVQAVDGRYYGYFTTRVMIKYLSEDEAREVEATLIPKAVPDLWRAMADQ